MKREIVIKPQIGTKMYFVQEHMYYVKDFPAPILEYCICEGNVKKFFTNSYVEMMLTGKNSKGHNIVSYFRLKDINKEVFYTIQEAAQLAKEKTEDYERRWGWLGSPDIPLRRTWEQYLPGNSK